VIPLPNKREVAWRLFAEEFNGSKLEIRGEAEYAPTYVVTPLGAMVNRMFAVGVLTDVENIGQPEEPLYRGRVVDPTGTFYISAGQYQPEAAKKLAAIKTPAVVAVVGKVRTYSPEAGTVYVSVRPEDITEVSPEIRDLWIVETARLTRDRVEGMTEALSIDKPTEEGLVKAGYSLQAARGLVKAVEFYGEVDVGHFAQVADEAVRSIVDDSAGERLEALRRASAKSPTARASANAPLERRMEIQVEAGGSSAPVEVVVTPTSGGEASEDQEAVVFQIVKELDKGPKGAAYDEIIDRCVKKGVPREAFDDLVNALLDKGKIYEPVLGQLKII
jgi:RPA family protein